MHAHKLVMIMQFLVTSTKIAELPQTHQQQTEEVAADGMRARDADVARSKSTISLPEPLLAAFERSCVEGTHIAPDLVLKLA